MRVVADGGAAVAAAATAPFAAAALALRLHWRRGLAERLGGGGAGPRRPVWIHGASVGEVRASLCLVDGLRGAGHEVVLSSQTVTGRSVARRSRPEVPSRLAPLDHRWCAERALSVVDPAALVLVEAELWPAWIAAADRRGVPVLSVSAGMSAASFRRWRRVRPLFSRTLRRLCFVGARSPRDAARFIALGARPDAVAVTGDLKFEAEARSAALAPDLDRALGGNPLFAAGSTHAGEEAAALAALAAVEAGGGAAVLALAPRQPARFDAVAALVRGAGRRLRRRSRLGGGCLEPGDVLLLDGLGELPAVYGRAVAAFVGGTLAPVGGHNLLEPARAGTPVCFGPHTARVESAADLLRACGAGICVGDGAALARVVAGWLADPVAAEALGARAAAAVGAGAGAAARCVGRIEAALASRVEV